MASLKEISRDCYFYYNATCARGDSCTFRHEPAALGSEVVCELWNQGVCYRPHCPFRHSNIDRNHASNGISCFFENQAGGCLKPNCPYFHFKPRPSFLGGTNDNQAAKVDSIILPNPVSIAVSSSITLPNAESSLGLPAVAVTSSQLQIGNIGLESVQAVKPSIIQPSQSLHLPVLNPDLSVPSTTVAPTLVPPVPGILPSVVGEQSEITGTSFQDQVRMFKEMLSKKEPSPKPDKRLVRNVSFSSESSGFDSDKEIQQTERRVKVKSRKQKSQREDYKKERRGHKEKTSIQKERYPSARNPRPRQRYEREYVQRYDKQYNREKQYKSLKPYANDRRYYTDRQSKGDRQYYTDKHYNTEKQYNTEKEYTNRKKKSSEKKKSKKYKERKEVIDEDEFSEELIKNEEDEEDTEDNHDEKEVPKKLESMVEVVSEELKDDFSDSKTEEEKEEKQHKSKSETSSDASSEKSSDKTSEKTSDVVTEKMSDKLSDKATEKDSAGKQEKKQEKSLDFHIKSYEEILREKALKKMLERRREIKERQAQEAQKKGEKLNLTDGINTTSNETKQEIIDATLGSGKNIEKRTASDVTASSGKSQIVMTKKASTVHKVIKSGKDARLMRFAGDAERPVSDKIAENGKEDKGSSEATKKSDGSSSQDSPKKIKFVRKVAIKGAKTAQSEKQLEMHSKKLKARKSVEIYKPPRTVAVTKDVLPGAGRVSPAVELDRKAEETKKPKDIRSTVVVTSNKPKLEIKSLDEIMKEKKQRSQQEQPQNRQKSNGSSLDQSNPARLGTTAAIGAKKVNVRKIGVKNSVSENIKDVNDRKADDLLDEDISPPKRIKIEIDEELPLEEKSELLLRKSPSPTRKSPSPIEDIMEAVDAELRKKKEDLMSDDELERELDLGNISSGDDLEDLNEDDLLLEIEEMINS